MKPTYDLVLGAGGVKGYAHIGVLLAAAEHGIEIKTVTGVSVGAAIAALYTNGFTPERILELFDKARERALSGDLSLVLNSLIIPDALQLMIGRSFVSLVKPWQQEVEALGLKPNDRLQLVACDRSSGEPVVFKGTDYDLAVALAGSGSLPEVFAPVWHHGRLLVDGAHYHYNPSEFSDEPALVVRLGRVTEFAHEVLSPLDAYFHWREQFLPFIPGNSSVDTRRNYVIDIPCADVAGLSFGTSKKRCHELVQEGYRAASVLFAKLAEDAKAVTETADQ